MEDIVEPTFSDWQTVWNRNRDRRFELFDRFGAPRVSEARAQIFEAAQTYTKELTRVAREAGLTVDVLDVPTPESGLVMAGHQPVVYHPGLLFKNELLSRFARERSLCAVNVVVDTDEGDAGRILWPDQTPAGAVLRDGTVATSESLYLAQRVSAAAVVDGIFDEIIGGLERSGAHVAISSVDKVRALYTRLQGVPAAAANSIVRWTVESRAYLELPLSSILRLPAVASILVDWISNAEQLFVAYNETLDAFRLERKIKNPANPFPNMKRESHGFELPLWLVDTERGTRLPAFSSGSGLSGLQPSEVIAPRGSILTLLLRGIASDLFIHGLGGAKYDPFVDAFAARHFGASLPAFTVASRTRYLFPAMVERYRAATDLERRYKEVVSHTEKFLGGGFFTSEEEEILRGLISIRPELLKQLGAAASPESRSEVAHRLNALNRDVRAFLDASSLQQMMSFAKTQEPIVKAWFCREFPFFFF